MPQGAPRRGSGVVARSVRKPSNTNNGRAVGVGTRVDVEVGSGVDVGMAVGTRVSLGRGVTCGCGGVLTQAANALNKKTSHIPFAIFTAHTRKPDYDF